MPLEMREHCEKCRVALPHEAAACICSYECTFCPACSQCDGDHVSELWW